MKRLLGLAMVFGLVLGIGSAVIAEDTANIAVTANVVGTCRFLSGATLDFGALDPSSNSDVNASTSTTFWCTRNVSYSITDDDGLYESGSNANRMQHSSITTEYIPYSFSYSPALGTGNGPTTPITLTISGTVTFANYQNAAAGDYADTVVLSITP